MYFFFVCVCVNYSPSNSVGLCAFMKTFSSCWCGLSYKTLNVLISPHKKFRLYLNFIPFSWHNKIKQNINGTCKETYQWKAEKIHFGQLQSLGALEKRIVHCSPVLPSQLLGQFSGEIITKSNPCCNPGDSETIIKWDRSLLNSFLNYWGALTNKMREWNLPRSV